jgi:hypothetical protein
LINTEIVEHTLHFYFILDRDPLLVAGIYGSQRLANSQCRVVSETILAYLRMFRTKVSSFLVLCGMYNPNRR